MLSRLIHFGLWGTALVLACLAYGFSIEPYRLVVQNVTIASPHWVGAPLRIGVISDIHVGGRHVTARRVEKIMMRLNAEGPEIVLVAGDFANERAADKPRNDKRIADIDAGLSAFASLKTTLGVYAVLGNHDYLFDPLHVRSRLEAVGVIFVDNRAEVIDDRLCLFGFGDDYYGQPNRNGRDACSGNFPIIGLMHNPDSFDLATGGEALMIAGHTHGGQINIPGIGRRVTATRSGPKYAYGLIDVNGTPAFITAGIGMSMLSARFRSPPEIVIITLQAEPT